MPRATEARKPSAEIIALLCVVAICLILIELTAEGPLVVIGVLQ